MTAKRGGDETGERKPKKKKKKKKPGKKRRRKEPAAGTNCVSTLVFRFYVEKCVSATNAPLGKNVSRYKRNRLFRAITDFRPVNDFFESFTP